LGTGAVLQAALLNDSANNPLRQYFFLNIVREKYIMTLREPEASGQLRRKLPKVRSRYDAERYSGRNTQFME
jgi:hypothetical protein